MSEIMKMVFVAEQLPAIVNRAVAEAIERECAKVLAPKPPIDGEEQQHSSDHTKSGDRD